MSAEVPHRIDWQATLAPVARYLASQPASTALNTLVLLPFAQLLAVAREAWQKLDYAGLGPRFETTSSWAAACAGFWPSDDDFTGDAAHDWPVALRLLQGFGTNSTAGKAVPAADLASQLCEAAAELSGLAVAQPLELRMQWARQALAALPQPGEGLAASLHAEARISQTALAWLGSSCFASDALWQESAMQVFVLPGLGTDPLADALAAYHGGRWLPLTWVAATCAKGHGPSIQTCLDAHDEAQACTALVLHLLASNKQVALVANDRWLVRRVLATLGAKPDAPPYTLRDETGWRLSTTRAGTQLMAWLQAARFQASVDDVLAALKSLQMPCDALEAKLRSIGHSQWAKAWAALEAHDDAASYAHLRPAIVSLHGLAAELKAGNSLHISAQALMASLQARKHWDAQNEAAQAACEAALATQANQALSQAFTEPQFRQWVQYVLESTNFQPPDHAIDPNAPVLTVVPLGQLMARRFDAVVLAGAGEDTMQAPNPANSWWTAAQRTQLGLPTVAELHAQQQQAFDLACAQPDVHVMWRSQHEGNERLPSLAVQRLLTTKQVQAGQDHRVNRLLHPSPCLPPLPNASAWRPLRISASALRDWRTCPYRYWALHLLKARPADELEAAPTQADWGSWLHKVMELFHRNTAISQHNAHALMERAVTQANRINTLDAVDFLPFQAAWPVLRERYFAWLFDADAQNNHPSIGTERKFEHELAQPGGIPITLVGTVDRIAAAPNASANADAGACLIDYKSDGSKTAEALKKDAAVDVQLPFYAALVAGQGFAGDNIQAGYLSLNDGRDKSVTFEPHPNVQAASVALMTSLHQDLAALEAGQPMLALGSGAACTHCAARGLCRRDHWPASDDLAIEAEAGGEGAA